MITPEQLVADYLAHKQAHARPSGPAGNNRCSTIGHPCTAYCILERVVPADRRAPTSPHLAMTFAEGNAHEDILERNLRDMGYKITNSQSSLSWPKFQLSGHKDFEISMDGPPYQRCELKSCSPFIFGRLHTSEHVRMDKWFIVRKWYYQIVLYMLLDGQKSYWLILKNKVSGAIKVLPFEWNDATLGDAEAMLKKAERVNAWMSQIQQSNVGLGDMPGLLRDEKINDPKICPECSFFTVCAPHLSFGPGIHVVSDEDLIDKVEKRGELEGVSDEFLGLDDELKEYFKLAGKDGTTAFKCGSHWLVELRRHERRCATSTQHPDGKMVVTRVEFARVDDTVK